jgi:Xaa-Pro aminopeptidase
MERLGRLFDAVDADALFIANPDLQLDANYFYLTGLGISNSYFFARRREERVLLASKTDYEQARSACDFAVEKFETRDALWGMLAKMLARSGRVGVDKRSLSAFFYSKLRRNAKHAEFADVSNALERMRSVKEPAEIAAIRRAVRIARASLEDIEIKSGKSEAQLKKELQIALLERDADGNSFAPIVLSGRNTRFPHGKSTGRKIRPGDAVLIDFGARWRCYCSDLTRCFFMGKQNVKAAEAYALITEVFHAVADSLAPGIAAKEAALLADAELRKRALPALPHGIGHGIGIEVHELPSLKKESGDAIAENSVFTIEPAVYTKTFGVRYEEVLMMGKNGARVL